MEKRTMKKHSIFTVTQTPKGHNEILTLSPDIVREKYCAVINVSDSCCATFAYQRSGIPSFWFPVDEFTNWGYSPFFGTLNVVNNYFIPQDEKKILIHCHAGANRSPSIAFSILISKGYSPEEAENFLQYPDLRLVFRRNIKSGLIPSNIIDFLIMADQNPKLSLNKVLCKLDSNYSIISKTLRDKHNKYDLQQIGESGYLRYNFRLKRFIHITDRHDARGIS